MVEGTADLQNTVRWGILGVLAALALMWLTLRLMRRSEERFREQHQGSTVAQMADDMADELPDLPEDPKARAKAKLAAYAHLDEAMREFEGAPDDTTHDPTDAPTAAPTDDPTAAHGGTSTDDGAAEGLPTAQAEAPSAAAASHRPDTTPPKEPTP